MPSPIESSSVPHSDVTKAKRFELPALDLKLGSLTDGTDIPPPLPSPIQDKAAPTPPDTPSVQQSERTATGETNGQPKTVTPHSQTSDASAGGTKRRAEDGPASPTLSSRPGSIRRLFSRGRLNNAYANGNDPSQAERPKSRGGSSIADSRKARRSSGWFGRLRGNDSVPYQPATPLSPTATEEKKPMGPPPPMIPELSELNSKLGIQNDNTLGDDLFKNIR